MISDNPEDWVKKQFEKLIDPVKIVFYPSKKNKKLDEDIENLLERTTSLTDLITYEKILNDTECISSPCISVKNISFDPGIRFMGRIDGGEFKTFIETLVMVSRNEYDLTERTLDMLEQIDQNIDIKVFTTNSCGWCPPVILKSFSFALASKYIKATAIDCYTFTELAVKYNVATVPKVVINEKIHQIGLKDENEFLGNIFASIS